jgi:hypothetical protein
LYKDIGIVNDVKLGRLQWAGHVITMPEERIPRKVMMGRLEGVRPIGRPRKRWMDGVSMYLSFHPRGAHTLFIEPLLLQSY